MTELKELLEKVLLRNKISLRKVPFDPTPHVRDLIPFDQAPRFPAAYAVSAQHPLHYEFWQSCLAGSFLLGRCHVAESILFMSDIRGDELKRQGDVLTSAGLEIPVEEDETIAIENSLLVNTLVHNISHDPSTPELFPIINTIAAPYANIHGAPSYSVFYGPFATLDLTTARECVIGTFSYVQCGELYRTRIDPGTIWIDAPDMFSFTYRYPIDQLRKYVNLNNGKPLQGIFYDIIAPCADELARQFTLPQPESPILVPDSSSLDRLAVVKGETTISDNVLVASRAYLENASLGKGANAQENCLVINARLAGNNVSAHGAKIIEADLATGVFSGFNSLVRGRSDNRVQIGADCIIMPHTIIDAEEPLEVPAGHLVWGLIKNHQDLESHSIPADKLTKTDESLTIGDMTFKGSGAALVKAFRARIHHILEENGAFYDGKANEGHAQRNRKFGVSMVQPFPDGDSTGMCPTITVQD